MGDAIQAMLAHLVGKDNLVNFMGRNLDSNADQNRSVCKTMEERMDSFDVELAARIRKERIEALDARLQTLLAREQALKDKGVASWDDFDRIEGAALIAQFQVLIEQSLLMREAIRRG